MKITWKIWRKAKFIFLDVILNNGQWMYFGFQRFSSFYLLLLQCFAKQAGFFTRMAKKSRRQKIGKLCSLAQIYWLFLGTFAELYFKVDPHMISKGTGATLLLPDNPILWENTTCWIRQKQRRSMWIHSMVQYGRY